MIQSSYSWPGPPSWLKGISAGRENFLSAVPLTLRETTCRCLEKVRWYYNEERQMWVCFFCNKPSPAHQGYNVQCLFGCEEVFTIWKFPVHESADISEINEGFKQVEHELCKDCGGNNDARLFM